MENMAQFKPVESSFRIDEGRESESEVVTRDMVSDRFHEYKQRFNLGFKCRGQGP